MNSEIEQRIVAMYFDNKDFEKNAKQTINTLGELKENLNLEDSVKGFDELDKAGKKLNLNQARNTIKNLKDSVGSLGDGLKKAFDIGSAPLHALDNFFGTFRGYVGKFLGFDLASKFVGSLESAIRQLTVAPVEAGWNMYQQNIDSTKTIMSGTLQSYKKQMSETNADWTYDEAAHMDYVKDQLAELSSYAQKTVFSLSDMTSNVGKFTNNNIDLETSVTAMEGIANMAAKAGQGAQQASMAMYNFSQALGVGKMTSIDWKSIENANMATTELKNLFIQTAEASGKLQKEVTKMADGKEMEKFFITVDKNGKKLAKKKWIEVSAENFRDSLSNGWLDKETMLRVMQIYSNKITDPNLMKAWGFSDEQINELMELGRQAEESATQVRTFSKMWDAMTESVQSGWADSMQYVFGDMREATDFWSTVNDKVGSVLDEAAKKRNDMLREWRGLTLNEETGEWERLEGAIDGREDLVQGIYGVIDAAKSLGSAFSGAWEDVFGSLTGKKLQEITKGFRDFVDRFKNWLGDLKDGQSRLTKLRKVISGVLSVFRLLGNVIKTLVSIGVQVVKPFIDPLLDLFAKFGEGLDLTGAKNLGEMLNLLRERFSALWGKLGEMGLSGIFDRIGNRLKELWTKITGGIGQFLDDNGLGGVKEWFIQLGDKIKEGYETVKTWWEGSGIPDFFSRIWNEIVGWFKPKEITRYNGSMLETTYEDSPIVSFFKGLVSSVEDAWKTVKDWEGWNKIGSFFKDLWNKITGWFTPHLDQVTYDSSGRHEHYKDSPIVSFFKGIVSSVESAWESVKGWDGWNKIGKFFEDVWNKITGWFKPKLGQVTYDSSGRHEHYEDSPIVSFFKGIVSGVESAWETVKGWEGWSAIGKFFKDLWNKITGWFTPQLDQVTYDSSGRHEHYKDSPIVSFFKGIVSGVESAWKTIKEWKGWEAIDSFFKDLWNKASGWFKPKLGQVTYDSSGRHEHYEDSPIVAFFKRLKTNVESAWNALKGWEGWTEIGNFFTDIWGWIEKLFQSNEGVTDVASQIVDAATEGGKDNPEQTEKKFGFLERIVQIVSDFIGRIAGAVDGIVIPPEMNEFFVNLGDVMKGMFKVISDILGVIGRLLNGNTNPEDFWLLVKIIGIFLGEKVFSLFNNRYLSKIETESFAKKFMELGLGLLAVAGAISLLATVDQSNLWTAVGALSVMGLVMGGIIALLNQGTLNKNTLAQTIGQTPTERVLTRLIGAIEKIGMIAVAMAMLPDVIKAFGEAKKYAPDLNGMDILGTMAGLGIFITTTALGFAMIDRITGNKGIDPVAALKTSVSVIGFIAVLMAGVLGIAALLEGIFGTEAVVQTLEQGGQMLAALGGAISSMIGGLIGGFAKGFNVIMDGKTEEEKLNDSLAILESLGDKLEIFTTDKTTGISRILNLVGLLAQTMDDVPETSEFTKFTDTLEPLASSVMKFALILSGFTLPENKDKIPLESMKERIMALVEIMRAFDIPDLSVIVSSGKNKVDYFVQGIDKLSEEMTPERFEKLASFMANLTEAFNKAMDPNGEGMKTMSGDLMKNLSAAIRIGLGDGGKYELGAFDATPIIDSITTALGYGETSIATAVHNMVQAGIDAQNNGKQPALDTSGITDGLLENNMVEELMNAAMNGGNPTATLTKLTEQTNEMLYGKGGSKDSPKDESLMGILSGVTSEVDNVKLPNIGEKFSEAFSFKDPETGQDLDLTSKLHDTLTSFEEELGKDTTFEIKIVPTFDLSNLNEESLRNALGDYPVGLPIEFTIPDLLRVDFTGLATELGMDEVRTKIQEVTLAIGESKRETVQAIGEMGRQISALGYDIRQLKLYLDTGVLVGGIIPMIDSALGRRADWADTGGIPIGMFEDPYKV